VAAHSRVEGSLAEGDHMAAGEDNLTSRCIISEIRSKVRWKVENFKEAKEEGGVRLIQYPTEVRDVGPCTAENDADLECQTLATWHCGA